MATLAQGEPRTIVVNPSGPPSNTLSFVLPPGVTISLESVLAAIDASGAGDTTATLTIADSSKAVIARKAQGQAVTGGVVGSATWALRLDDEAPSASGGDVALLWSYTVPAGGQATVDSNVDGPLAGLFSQAYSTLEILNLTRTDTPAVAGGYLMQFNADAGAHYFVLAANEQGGPPPVWSLARPAASVSIGPNTIGAAGAAGRAGSFVVTIPGYSSTDFHKSGYGTAFIPASGAVLSFSTQEWFCWNPVAVAGINRVWFKCTGGDVFVKGSTFAVYGRK